MSEHTPYVQIIESLRKGIPPQRGVEHYSVGNEKLIDGVKQRHLSGVGDRGIIRFVSGSWGAGKTHFFRLLQDFAFHDDCLVSNVELDVNNAALNKFERVFYSILSNVKTPTYYTKDQSAGIAPFGIVLQESLHFLGEGNRELKQEVPYETYSKACETLMANHGIDIDFKKIVQKYWETFLPESPEPAIVNQTRGELLQWFAGEGTVGSYRKRFGVSKMVSKENAKLMLQSLSEFVRLCGYRGLLILFDEAERAYSIMRKSSLRDAHNNLLSLINNVESLKGLFLIYATTPDFYTDPKHGIVIYGALATRIGKPEPRPPRALDVIWNLDHIETSLEEFQQAAGKICEIYTKAYPEATKDLPKPEEMSAMVSELSEIHPSLSAVRFWRLLVTALIQHFDDRLEGEVRSTEQLYDDVMDRLRED